MASTAEVAETEIEVRLSLEEHDDPSDSGSDSGSEYIAAEENGEGNDDDDAENDEDYGDRDDDDKAVDLADTPESATGRLQFIEKKLQAMRVGPPPRAITYERFRDFYHLHAGGVNTHKCSTKAGVSEMDLVRTFGPKRKGKSGYPYGHLKDFKLVAMIEHNYKTSYQKSTGPSGKLIGRHFAVGVVAEVVNKMEVDWAGYAAGTNNWQRSSWRKRVVGLAKQKSVITGKAVNDILEDEGFNAVFYGGKGTKGEAVEPSVGKVEARGSQSLESWNEKRRKEVQEVKALVMLESDAARKEMEMLQKEVA